MKQKGLYIASLIFFLLVNTTYFWESKMGIFAMLTFLLLVIYFLVLSALLFGQLFFTIREKFKNRKRLYVIAFMTFVLGSTLLFPRGLIDFIRFESNSVLIAQREGAANCMTTIELKENKTFTEKNICFGVTETTGTYRLKSDTIFFENVALGRQESDFYKFAVIKKIGKKSSELVRYESYSDTIGIPLFIVKNELNKINKL